MLHEKSQQQLTCTLCEFQTFIKLNHQHRVGVDFYRCKNCDLIFIDPAKRPGPEVEKNRYLLHQNKIDDANYVATFTKLIQLLEKRFPFSIRNQISGLDFGSGPEPVLQKLLQDKDFQIQIYDPFFANQNGNENRVGHFDFITATEVVEHFHSPQKMFAELKKLLKQDGTVFLQTQLTDNIDFSNWWYVRDLTHVSFYSLHTIKWIQNEYSLDVVLT